MNPRNILTVAGASLAVATVCGALAAHGLKSRLTPVMLDAFETGVRYQFYHSLGLLGIGVFAASRQVEGMSGLQSRERSRLNIAAALLIAGIALFSGSLYALALGSPRFLGAVTPLGGIALISGWIAFVIALRSADR